MTNKRYLIGELAALAGTTVRTIRYYTDEGLLPQPEIETKYAYYNDAHLNRLQLIFILKNSFLPLSEIRAKLNSLTDAEVEELVRKQSASRIEPSEKLYFMRVSDRKTENSTDSSALEYVNRLLGEQAGGRTPGGARLSQEQMLQNPAPLPAKPLQTLQSRMAAPPSETWRRVVIVDGVELNLREPVGTDVERRIEQLLLYARKVFQK